MDKDNENAFNKDLDNEDLDAFFLTDRFKDLIETRKNEALINVNKKKVIYSTLGYLFRIAVGLDCIFIVHWYTLGAFWLGWAVLNIGFDLGQVYALYKDKDSIQ